MRAMSTEDVDEFQLIEMLAGAIAEGNADLIGRVDRSGFRIRLGIGDDAAAWDAPAGTRVLTTDTLVEGVHFELDHIGWSDLGWKAMAVNLSDVAAMGCRPLYFLVTLGLRRRLPADGLVEMYQGMLESCRRFGGTIVGGDVVRSPTFFVSATLEGAALGAEGGPLLTRGAAAVGDRIAVTGHIGCSAAGLRMRNRMPDLDRETADHLREAHNRPVSRVAEGLVLAERGVLCGMDVSDGLVDDLGKVCNASGVGAVVHADSVPADDFLKRAFPDGWLELSLAGGEDYELLFTAPQAVMDEVVPLLDCTVATIGDIVAGPSEVKVVDREGEVVSAVTRGWDHLRDA